MDEDGARLVAVERMLRAAAYRQNTSWGLTGPPGGGDAAGPGGIAGGGPGSPGGPIDFGWLGSFGFDFDPGLIMDQLRPGAFDPNGMNPFGFDPWNPPGPWSDVTPPGPAPDTTPGPPGTGTYTVTCRWGSHTGVNLNFPPGTTTFTVSGNVLITYSPDTSKHTDTFHDTSEFPGDVFGIILIIDPSTTPPTCTVRTVSGAMAPGTKGLLTWWVDKNQSANEGTPVAYSNIGVPDVDGVLVASHDTWAEWDFSTTSAMGWGFQNGDAIVTILKTS